MLNRSTRLAGKKSTEATDVNAKYTSLHINGETPAPSWNADQSNKKLPVTSFSDVKPSTFSPYATGAYSVYFNGTSDYISGTTVTLPTSTETTFTVEAWVYMTETPPTVTPAVVGDMQVASTLNYWSFGFNNTRRLQFLWYDGASKNLTTDNKFELNTWYHIAVSINRASIMLFVNGQAQRSSGTKTLTNRTGTTALGIGLFNTTTGGGFKGYISNLRITRGESLYNASFTPSTVPLTPGQNTTLLTCQDSRLIDNGFNSTLTKGSGASISSSSPFSQYLEIDYKNVYSGYFDGTGDYITTSSGPELGFGTGDFTVEGWWYFTGTISTYQRPWWFGDDNDNLDINGSVLRVGGASQGSLITGTTTIQRNTWYHIALTRTSGVYKLWLNGVQEGNSATNSYNSSARVFAVNATNAGANPVTGYTSNIRIIKGQSIYTGTFTPPTKPLEITQPADTNIAAIDYKGSSAYFDGSTTYYNLSSPTDTAIRKSDFTWEAWVYPSSTAAFATIYDTSAAGDTTATGRFLLAMEAGGQVRLTTDAGTTVLLNSGASTLTAGQWTHIAVVRSGTSGAMYFNGTSVNTNTFSTDFLVASAGATNRPIIGANGYNAGNKWPGLISNLRLVVGKALYTGAFTAPTSTLGLTQANTTNIVAMTGIPTNGESTYYGTRTNFISVPATSNLTTFTGDFTFEAWVKPTDTSITSWSLWDARQSGATANPMVFLIDPLASPVTGQGRLRYFNGVDNYGTGIVYYHQWNHVAFVRAGSTMTFYVNGVAGGTATVSGTQTASATSNPIYIGSKDTGAGGQYGTVGYISDFRIVNGTAVYNSNFTPPTEPLTAITNTALLACQGKTLVDKSSYNATLTNSGTTVSITQSPYGYTPAFLLFQDSKYWKDKSINNYFITKTGTARASGANPFGPGVSLLACQTKFFKDRSIGDLTITVSGDATVAPKNPFGLTNTVTSKPMTTSIGSTVFDGDGDHVLISPNTDMTLGTNDFTIECWWYANASQPTYSTVYAYASGSTNQASNSLYFSPGTGTASMNLGNGAAGWVLSTTWTATMNTWHHHAFVRRGSTFTVYHNGVAVSTAEYTGSITAQGSFPFQIGGQVTGSGNLGSTAFNGYVSDFRVVNGTALYEGSFIPPARQLTNIPNTQLLTLQTSQPSDNNTYLDASNWQANTIQRFGNVTVGTFSPYGDGWSYQFNGGSYLDIQGTSTFSLINGNFTIEFWIYLTATPSSDNVIIQKDWTNTVTFPAFMLLVDTTRALSFQIGDGSAGYIQGANSTAGAININTWYHVAAVRKGKAITTYINGSPAGSVTQTGTMAISSNNVRIGASQNPGNYFNGYISNLRIIKGIALYTATFTPPVAPFLPSSAPTGSLSSWSNYFPGNGNYLTGSNAAFNVSNQLQAWTIECWVYPIASLSMFAIGSGGPYGNSLAIDWGFGAANKFRIYQSNGSSTPVSFNSTGTYNVGNWYHIAVSNDTNGVRRLFVNGILDNTATYTAGGLAGGTTFVINGLYDNNGLGNNGGTGYIKDLRFSNSTLYTANFTVPTGDAVTRSDTVLLTCQDRLFIDKGPNNFTITKSGSPVTTTTYNSFNNTSNTSLLIAQTNTLEDQSLNKYAITRTGSVAVRKFSPFITSIPSRNYYSYYFDGTGDNVIVANQGELALGTYDFTIECWINLQGTQTTTYGWGIAGTYPGNGGYGWSIVVNRTSGGPYGVAFIASPGGTSGIVTGTSTYLDTNRWYHIAVTRASGSIQIYIDGALNATGTANYNESYHRELYIGSQGAGQYFTGYITDLRIVRGTSVYTGNTFVVPNVPLGTTETVRPGVVQINLPTSYSLAFGTANVAPYNRDFIEIPNSAALTFATGNFTLEGWTYQPNVASGGTGPYDAVFFSKSNPGQNPVFETGWYVGNQFFNTDTGSIYQTTPWSGNTWIHWAIQRFNNNWYAFAPYNGSQQLVATFAVGTGGAAVTEQQAPIYLGFSGSPWAASVGSGIMFANANIYLSGFISNMRLTKNQALFDTSGTYGTNVYVPSNSPLTTNTVGHVAVAANGVAPTITGQVVLLTGLTSTIQDISANANPMFAVNGAKVSTWSPFNANGVILLALQSNTLIDRSTFPLQLRVNGDVRPTTVSPYSSVPAPKVKYWTPEEKGSSYYFDGNGDYISIPVTTVKNIDNWKFTPRDHSDFCVECWAYMTGANPTLGAGLVARQQANGIGMYAITLQPSTGYVQGISSSVGTGNDVVARSTVTLQTNTWVHLAYTRYANVFSLYYNGNIVARTASTANLMKGGGDTINIGRANVAGTDFAGYLSDIRITVNDTPYKNMFAVPTEPILPNANTTLLLRNTPGLIDWSGNKNVEFRGAVRLSSNVVRYNSRSIEFDGTGLLAIQDADFGQTGDFTIEGWWYPKRLANGSILSVGGEQASRISFNFTNLGSNVYTVYRDQYGGGGWSGQAGRKATVGGNVWNHIVFQRSGGTLYTYINGIEAGNAVVNASTMGTSNGLYIGGAVTGAAYQGYLDDFKIYNYAKYNANIGYITPPNASNYSAIKQYSVRGNAIVDALVVAGGGAGGFRTDFFGSGGGGGGGLIVRPLSIPSGANLTITIGQGGANVSSAVSGPGGDGGNSSIAINGFITVEAVGGGGGGYSTDNIAGAGRAGGSGGGGARTGGGGNGYQGGNPYLGGQGFAGGTGIASDGSSAGSGGGGAGGTVNNPGGAAGVGGPGLYLTISGSNVAYAGGGGAGGGVGLGGSPGAAGGVGGGGAGSANPGTAFGTPGGFATGGGGGGNGGRGGSGIVILRHPISYGRMDAPGANTITIANGYYVYTYTSNGYFNMSNAIIA